MSGMIMSGKEAEKERFSHGRSTETGGLKPRDWKTRDHEKYGGGKRRTGKRGTKSQGWKRQDWKTLDQISRVENARQPSMER